LKDSKGTVEAGILELRLYNATGILASYIA